MTAKVVALSHFYAISLIKENLSYKNEAIKMESDNYTLSNTEKSNIRNIDDLKKEILE